MKNEPIQSYIIPANPGFVWVNICTGEDGKDELVLDDPIIAWRIEIFNSKDISNSDINGLEYTSVVIPITTSGDTTYKAGGIMNPDFTVNICEQLYPSLESANKHFFHRVGE